MKQDFNQRITLILSSNLEQWQALNVASHLSAYFGNVLREGFGTAPHFITANQIHLPRNTQFPIIILKANFEELQVFAKSLHQTEELQKMFFIKEMLETTNDDKIEALVGLQDDDELTYLGVGLFGDNKIIKKVTNKFSLWS